MNDDFQFLIDSIHNSNKQLCVLTGAGISAESGIPTFRGPEGYWRQGSAVYQPMQLATLSMFNQDPKTVWSWYLYRRAICLAALPNSAHQALAKLEQQIPDRFTLITQNVDGLHRRAGNSTQNTLPIHGDIDRMRCTHQCCDTTRPIPESFDEWLKEQRINDAAFKRLRCPSCGAPARPHILWFDECYDETHYHFDSAIERAAQADMLWVIGTSGQTNLPRMLIQQAVQLGTELVEINPEFNDFSDAVTQSGGMVIRDTACRGLRSLLQEQNHA